ncbi:CHAT domain-containing protein [Micromonospora sp. WMMD1128]|uniref:CHAT domain-containing protein n=1 Tax=Micromonospora sp. WMMD1128 TaxID=3015150 RepID=UPI00248B45A6|nr:CHAT domain-containing protein [Micromonospora sp. WMMD1128]WBB75905.1 CHAT domain-containing protein [Micromonospora sp. WMMD1128]
MASSDAGQPGRAARELRAGLRLARHNPALREVHVRLLISLAWAESERGRVELGFRLLDEAEALVAAPQWPILLGQRALLLKRSGRNAEALRQYDAAVGLLNDMAHPSDLVKALNNRSLVHLEAGHVRLARADLRRCVEIAARHGFTLHVAMARTNLGCLDVIAGDLPSALRAFTLSDADYRSLAPGRLANLAVERARALVAAGLYREADRQLADAVQRATQQQLGHTYADALQVRAEAALLAGEPIAAARWASRARAAFLGRANVRRAALAALLELRADQAAGAVDQETVLRRAGALAGRLTRLGLTEDARVAHLVKIRALVSAGRPRRAAEQIGRQAGPRRTDRLDTRLLWHLTRAEVAASAGRAGEARRSLLAGVTALHRYRARFGCADLQTGAAVHGRDLARAGLAAALSGGSANAVYRWSERVRAQALLLPPVRPPDDPIAAEALEELRQLRHSLREAELAGRPTRSFRSRSEELQRVIRERAWATPGPRDAVPSAPAPLAAVTAELAGAALVLYVNAGDILHALVVTDRAATVVALGRRATAEEAVRRLRADLDAQAGRAMPGRLAAVVRAATRRDADLVGATVLDPVLPLVGDRELVVVPTGMLLTTPWHTLPACASRPVTVAPSVAVWLAARRRLHAGAPTGGAVVVSGPGIHRGEAEARAVASLHPGAVVLTGAEATPAAALIALAGARVAHVAAHGQHQTENPLFSTLELTGGPLMGYDVQGLRVAPRTVVLSCCDLGLTDVRHGDEALGMPTALLAAGTATVVASVARVGDEAATEAMVAYHRAVGAGRSPAAALAEAATGDQPSAFVCFGAG